MATVNIDQCNEVAQWLFATEASTLGLAPGDWPSRLATDMGNGMDFALTHHNWACDYVEYKQRLGILRLRVFND